MECYLFVVVTQFFIFIPKQDFYWDTVEIQRPKDEPDKTPGTERDKIAKEVYEVNGKREVAVTWADIVKGTDLRKPGNQANSNKVVLGSLSQNNPVSKDEV